MATSSFNFDRMFLNLVFFVLQIGNGFHSLLFDDFAFAWNSDSLWFVICCLETFCKENDSWCICGTGKWTSIILCRVPEFDARGWFLFALVHRSFSFWGAVRLHQPDQVKHYLFGGVRSFITITGDSGFLFTLLRTRFWTCNFLFRILSSVLHLIYVNAGNFFWRDFLSTAF